MGLVNEKRLENNLGQYSAWEVTLASKFVRVESPGDKCHRGCVDVFKSGENSLFLRVVYKQEGNNLYIQDGHLQLTSGFSLIFDPIHGVSSDKLCQTNRMLTLGNG